MVIDKPLTPATEQEEELIADIKSELEELRNTSTTVTAMWTENMDRVYELIAKDDIRSFLRWDVVQKTMFVTNEPYVRAELSYLKGLPNWKGKWSKAIIESGIGHPTPSVFYRNSSGNLIHHAYHLAQFEEKTGIQMNEFSFVFEFGGGYGSMCRLFHNLGFSGHYVILDLPPLSAIQKYYLKALSLPVQPSCNFEKTTESIVCLSSLADFERALSMSTKKEGRESLFLATWSLSETTREFRDEIVSVISDFNNMLIAYQNSFSGLDNVEYFNGLQRDLRGMTWHNWEIEHLRGNYYLVGTSDS